MSLASATVKGSCGFLARITDSRATQESLFQRFHDALVPGGFLVLGKVETLLGPSRSLFAAVEPRERIFRRR